MPIILIIKGPPSEAAKAMAARGVKAIRELTPMGRTESRAVVSQCHLGAVVSWFCEDADLPFPDGTLLFYSAD